MCLYPIYIRNKKYTITKKNNGFIPEMKDIRTSVVAIGCGVCQECRKKRANEWKVRLNEEIKSDKSALFVTLTFNDDEYARLYQESRAKNDEEMLTYTIRRFKERVRKQFGNAKKMWLIQEYGKDYDRVHIHGLIWGMKSEDVEKRWTHGFVYIGDDITEKTINYIVKYCLKTDEKRPNWKPKIWCSPGLGKSYRGTINKYQGEKTRQIYICKNGARVGLPIYYRNKIYTEDEREKLWIQLLDKEERYIHGTRYDISTNQGLETWRMCLMTAQDENKRKKYGYIDQWSQKANRNIFNLNLFRNNLYNLKESCIFAVENKNTNTTIHERGKDKLRNLQMHETLAEHSNMGQRNNNGNHGSLQETDVYAWLRLRNNRNTRAGETDGKNTYIQTEGNKTPIINNLNKHNYGIQMGNHQPGHIDGFETLQNEERSDRSIHEFDRTRPREIQGYEVVDIDTGEIYTKVEYTKIKKQLKTISYEKRSRKGTRANGSKYIWYETKRFVRKIGREQFEIDFTSAG